MNKKIQNKRNYLKNGVILLLLLTCSLFSAKANGTENSSLLQQIKEKIVTINMKNKPIREILVEIKKQTAINFAIDAEVSKAIGNLSLTVNKVTVDEALRQLLKESGYDYEIANNSIVIVPKMKQSAAVIDRKITGKVIDKASKSPIPGATILVEGTTKGAITNDKGEFQLVVRDGEKIEISFVGMLTQTKIILPQMSNLSIALDPSELVMEDVVVTGIYERRSGSFTGSATSIKGEDLKKVGTQNVFQSLKNLDPSLMIFDNLEYGSDPNKNPKMALRGTSSFDIKDASEFDMKGTYSNDPNAPLFILDGFEATVQKISDLDMNRVESLTILKDASAKAIYGSKAANGVVVIETYKSKSSTLRISYRGSVEVQAPDLTSYNLTNAREKLEVEVDAGLYEDENLYTQFNLIENYNRILTAVVSGVDTDWMAKPLRSGIGTKHGLTFDIATDKLSLFASFSYNNTKGAMRGSDRTNYEGSISLSYRYKSLNFRNSLTINSNIANDSPYGSFRDYTLLNPYFSPVDEAGNIVQNANIIEGGTFVANPLYNATLNTLLSNEYIDFTNNVNIEWTIFQELKATGRFGITEKRTNGDEFFPANHLKFRDYSAEEYFRKGTYNINEGDEKRISGDFNIQFSKQIADKHYVFVNAGFNLSEHSYEEINYAAEGFPNDKMNDIIFAKSYAKDGKPKGRESTIRDIGLLLAANYAYDDRYLFDGSFRTNASSQFGKNNRWGKFWSLGLGWNIHKEKWFDNSAIQLLKLRGSVGYTGAQSAQAYGALATYDYITNKTYQGFLGAKLLGMKNDDLKWQDKLDYNVGLDFNLGRLLNFKFDYYKGISKNNVLSIARPTYTGFGSITENLGNVENRGFDARLSYTPWSISKERAYFTITTSLSSNKNKITGISDALKEYNDRQNEMASDRLTNLPVQPYRDNVSMDAIWAVRSLGIDPTDGQEIYLTKDGAMTKSYSSSNLVVCGNKLPKVLGNFGFSFGYKGVDLNIVFRYQYGAQLYNQTLVDKVENANLKDNVDKRVYDGRWRKKGDFKPYKTLGKIVIAEPGMPSKFVDLKTQATSRFVMDRNELTLGALSVGYDFYRFKFLQKCGMERLKVNFNMNDVFTLSSIKIERGTSYPFARAFNFSLEATF